MERQTTHLQACKKLLTFNHRTMKNPILCHSSYNSLWAGTVFVRMLVSMELNTAKSDKNAVNRQLEANYVQRENYNFQEESLIVASLKTCAEEKDLLIGSKIHTHVVSRGILDRNIHVGNSLVNLYGKCDELVKAQEVFDMLGVHDVVSWNGLIAGYSQHGYSHQALTCFQRMQQEGIFPNEITSSCIFKACGSIRAVDKGKMIQCQIMMDGLLGINVIVGNALLDMYVKGGNLASAREVFENIKQKDAISWNALIGSFSEHHFSREPLSYFNQMKQECIFPDEVTFVNILKACGRSEALEKAKEIHVHILAEGLLESNILVGNALLDMYMKCGAVAKAQEVFDAFQCPDEASLNTMISGYARLDEITKAEELLETFQISNVISCNAIMYGYIEQRCAEKALRCFERAQCEAVCPDDMTFTRILKACGSIQAVGKGKQIHAKVIEVEENLLILTAVMDMYAKCGSVVEAQLVFDELNIHDVISFTAIISGYAQYGYNNQVIKCFKQMHNEGCAPNTVTLMFILKACGSMGAVDTAKEIHAIIVKEEMVQSSVGIANALVEMYSKCNHLAEAHSVFDELLVRDQASWNALIARHVEDNSNEEAMKYFSRMYIECVLSETASFICILEACGKKTAIDKIKELHCTIFISDLLENNLTVGTALINAYADCGKLQTAHDVFDELQSRDLVSWNTLMAGYVKYGHGQDALNCFEALQYEGFSPDIITFSCILKACSILGVAQIGTEIHAEVARNGMLIGSILLHNVLIDMHIQCNSILSARDIFDEVKIRDVVSWNVLITGYAQNGHAELALEYFEKMCHEAILPDPVTYVCVLKASVWTGVATKAKEIHAKMISERDMATNVIFGTTIVDMYAKCGALVQAQKVFDTLEMQSSASWTALIKAYGQFGRDDIVFDSFKKMVGQGIKPDIITFTVLLNACSHSGQLEEGLKYYHIMTKDYSIEPTLEHQACMVDLYGRAGHIDKAVGVIESMANSDYLPVWFALLGACQKWGNVTLGKWAFEHIVRLDNKDVASYVAMQNIYAAAGMLDNVVQVQTMRMENGV